MSEHTRVDSRNAGGNDGAPDPGNELASERGERPRLGLSRYDRLPLLGIPAEVDQGGEEVLRATAEALYHEGGRGPAARRLLAREVAISLSQYRTRAALANVVLEPVLRYGRGDTKQLDAMERQVAGAFRRMTEALTRLAAIDLGPTPRVSVTAHNAQVNVEAAK